MSKVFPVPGDQHISVTIDIKYMRLYVRTDNPAALAFWESEGFQTV